MERYYSFAGVDIVIRIPKEKFYTEERHLAAFQTDCVSDPHCFCFNMVDFLPPPQGVCAAVQPGFRVYREGERSVRYIGSVQDSWEYAYIRMVNREKEHEIDLLNTHFQDKVSAKTVLNCLEAERLVVRAGGFILHSAYIEVNGKAILFTAPSGTGKSTQAELWRNLRGAEIINGDRAVVRCADDQIYACGIPFAGSSLYCTNRTLPLAAVIYLQQAPRTSIRRLRGYEAFSKIWEGCSVNLWEKEDLEQISEYTARTARDVPVFCLACTPDESAVIALEEAMKEVCV